MISYILLHVFGHYQLLLQTFSKRYLPGIFVFSKKLRLLELEMGRPGETEEERRIRKDKERKRRREKLKEGHPDDRDSRKK